MSRSRSIDSCAQLILDLESRGLLDRTLVIVVGEFSRNMLMEGKPGGSAQDPTTEKVDVIQAMKHYGRHGTSPAAVAW